MLIDTVETRPRLGGRATSLRDPRSGLVIDNCQHVLMGCCSNLIDLYDRLDVLDRIEWHRELYWTSGGGEVDADETQAAGEETAQLGHTGVVGSCQRQTGHEDERDSQSMAQCRW